MVFENEGSMKDYNRVIESFNNTNKRLVMTFEEHSPITSEAQESMFKALLVLGSTFSGYTYSEFEKVLIEEFAPYKYSTSILGDKIKIRKTVSEMSNKEFNVFIEQCKQFAEEFFDIIF